jgi:hypothetical protein
MQVWSMESDSRKSSDTAVICICSCKRTASMLLVHMLCSLCLLNHYIHVLSMPIVSSHAYAVWCPFKVYIWVFVVYCHSWWFKRYPPIDSNLHPLAFPDYLKHILIYNGSNSMRKLLIPICVHAKSHILVTSISQGRWQKLELIFCIDVPQRCLKQHAEAEYDCDMPTWWIGRSKSGNSKTGNPLLLNNYGS